MAEQTKQRSNNPPSRYWEKVQDWRGKLEKDAEPFYLTSLGDDAGAKAGVVRSMDHETAARSLAEGKFRVSDKKEIAAFEAEMEAARKAILEEDHRRIARAFIDPRALVPSPPAGEPAK